MPRPAPAAASYDLYQLRVDDPEADIPAISAAYAQATRDVAKELSAPLADCQAAYEDLRAKDPTAWRLLMSETIHPGMLGHKLFAEVIAETVATTTTSSRSTRLEVARRRSRSMSSLIEASFSM